MSEIESLISQNIFFGLTQGQMWVCEWGYRTSTVSNSKTFITVGIKGLPVRPRTCTPENDLSTTRE